MPCSSIDCRAPSGANSEHFSFTSRRKPTMKRTLKSFVLGGAVLTAVLGGSSPADACGGFFCSAVQPVNQAAEHIIFADNGDGTVTAVIEIMYEGPSENFSWLLPISSVPMGDQIAVASDV